MPKPTVFFMKKLNIFGPSALQKFVGQNSTGDLRIPRPRQFCQRIPQHLVRETEDSNSNSNSCEKEVVVLLAERPDLRERRHCHKLDSFFVDEESRMTETNSRERVN